ncbi:TPA: hypothetical protein ACFNPJ_001815, partial [Neisseria meningitidis]
PQGKTVNAFSGIFLGKFVMSLSDKVFLFSPNAAPPPTILSSPSSGWCAFVNMPSETRGLRRHFVSKRYLMYPHFVIEWLLFFLRN